MKRDFEDIEDISQRIQTIPEELPILPVRDAVIFPECRHSADRRPRKLRQADQ